MGSASILVISWMYIRMMGPKGLKEATQLALLNANYMAKQLELSYPILYSGRKGRVAHEFILDLRELTSRAGLLIDDIAKRLIDYGFHAPTMSFPVPGTLMIEPTESESREELDRFCEAMIAIRRELQEVIDGKVAAEDSALHHAPHTADDLTDEWTRSYTKEKAVFPLSWVRDRKFWPACNRIDNTYGDRNLICTCEWPSE
jgi:glycine dehydrogenase